MERPNVPKMLETAYKKLNLVYSDEKILYVLGQETFVELNKGSMPRMQRKVFAFLSRNSRNATHYFGLPPEQVIELGTQIDL
jgi:KUP system potassium uptake protein